MGDIILVGVGGFIGSILRYLVWTAIFVAAGGPRFPLGTFTINIIGCFVIGALSGVLESTELISASAKLFLLTGVLGGFTTFSAFGLETMALIKSEQFAFAALNACGQVIVGVSAVWLGYRLIGLLQFPGTAH